MSDHKYFSFVTKSAHNIKSGLPSFITQVLILRRIQGLNCLLLEAWFSLPLCCQHMYPHRRSITTVSVVLTNSLTHQHTFMPSFLLTSYTIYTTLHKGGQCTNPQEIESRYQYWNSHLVNSQHRQHTKCSQLVSFQGFIMVTIFISARD